MKIIIVIALSIFSASGLAAPSSFEEAAVEGFLSKTNVIAARSKVCSGDNAPYKIANPVAVILNSGGDIGTALVLVVQPVTCFGEGGENVSAKVSVVMWGGINSPDEYTVKSVDLIKF